MITGFTIGPGANKTVLVRAIGPTLGAFGVSGPLTDPRLELYAGDRKVAENDNFNSTDATTFASVGAFALAPMRATPRWWPPSPPAATPPK